MLFAPLADTDSFPKPYFIGGSGDYSFTVNTGDFSLTTEPFVNSDVRCRDCE